MFPVFTIHDTAFNSQVPRVVDTWRNDLKAKGRSKLATAIASPSENASLFEEGWEEALKRETGSLSTADIAVNGNAGRFSSDDASAAGHVIHSHTQRPDDITVCE